MTTVQTQTHSATSSKVIGAVDVCEWGMPSHSLLQRLGAIQQPVFVANGTANP